MTRINREFFNKMVSEMFYPGACILSTGQRGAGKSHLACAMAENLIHNKVPGMPSKVVMITNIVFVKKTAEGEFATESPEGVYHVTTMKQVFPIVADIIDVKNKKDVLILLVLDEAQNFLMGEMNNSGDMGKAMKSFAGLLRKWCMCLWLLTPTERNVSPTFRSFIDSEDGGNLTCTIQKDRKQSEAFVRMRGLDLDPRDIFYVKLGDKGVKKKMVVPKADWVRNPESLAIGEFAYDTLSSASFKVGQFDFFEFLDAVSDGSSYEMVKSIRRFYSTLEPEEENEGMSEEAAAEIRARYKEEIVCRMYCCESPNITFDMIGAAFGVSGRQARNWVQEYRKTHPELPNKK